MEINKKKEYDFSINKIRRTQVKSLENVMSLTEHIIYCRKTHVVIFQVESATV